jgi:VWFA-related protein
MRKALLAALAVLATFTAVPVLSAADELPASAVTIVPPEKEVPFGLIRVEADVKPPCVKVEFFLDGRKLVTRNRAPYTVEIDLGNVLARHVLKVAGFDAQGRPAGSDERVFNSDAILPPAESGEVTIQIATVDEKGQAVQGLRREDVEVVDGGTVRPILSVETAAANPLTLGIVLDVSARMKDALAPVRDALTPFLASAVTERDQGFVVQFRDAAAVSAPMTSKISSLITAIGESQAMGGSALRDGLVLALYQFRAGRRAVILLAEGSDTNSRADIETLLRYVRKAGVPIYPIAVNSGLLEFGPKSRLKELAAVTGGEAFSVGGKGLKGLPSVLARIEADLRAQYVVRFQPETGNSSTAVRAITVRVLRPGVRVRTVSTYAR